MRRLLFLLLLLTGLVSNVSAQTDSTDDVSAQSPDGDGLRIPTQAGNILAGANLLFSQLQFQKGFETVYNVGISPKAAFFVLPNLALGLSLDLSVEGHTGYQAINYGVSPFARVYFAHHNISHVRPLQFFVEGGVGFGGTNTHYESGGITTRATTNGARLYVMPGLDYFLNNRVAVETGVEYLFIGGKPDAHILELNVGFQVFLGR